ncbi:MAG: transporter substrate-binding domain-containing protein [Clostridiales bacterium]|jgi:L-cystine transport system substrate-binding protein|nr:transporter substrate-binding domain-containing protein [Clostridiales bacterium]
MKKIGLLKRFAVLGLNLILVSFSAACGSSPTANSNADAGNVEAVAATVIPVGVCSAAKPDAYIDDDGKLTGYDVETLRAIDELLPEYEFDLQTMEFSEILNSLATGKILAGSQQFEWNKEREEKYLFGTVPLVGYNTYIITLDDPQYANITGFKDLAGKTTYVSQGGSIEAQVNSWNEENPDLKINGYIGAGTSEEYVTVLNNRVVDFLVGTDQVYKYWTETFEITNWVLHTDAKVYDSNSFILFGKNQTELQQAADRTLKQLTDNGELAKLSIKFYGEDFTVK